MTQLFEIRTKIIEIYQKTETYLKVLFKALLYFLAFSAIKNSTGYNARLSNIVILLGLAAVSAFLPSSIVIAIMVVYIALQMYSASILMAGTVLIIALILFCFFLRFTPSYGNAAIGMPLLMGIRMPYVLPICLGLFSTPVTIIPVCVGVFAYYFINSVSSNMITAAQVKEADNPFQFYVDVLDSVVKNEAMFASMIVLSLVIIAVYLVRNIKMDYSFEIAIAVGSGTSMIGFIIMMLRYDIGVGIFSVLLFSVLSGVIAYAVNFIYRPLFYAGTEQVQFEDDYYYYYVKAVPKIKVAGTKVNVKQVVSRRTNSFDEDFGDELDEVDSNLAANAGNSLAGVTGRVLAGNPDDDDDIDELDDEPVSRNMRVRRPKNTAGSLTSARRKSVAELKAPARRRSAADSQVSAGRRSAADPKAPARRKNTADSQSPIRGKESESYANGTENRTQGRKAVSQRKAPVPKTASGKSNSRINYDSEYTRSYDDSDDDF